jgi:hypothetical protein
VNGDGKGEDDNVDDDDDKGDIKVEWINLSSTATPRQKNLGAHGIEKSEKLDNDKNE